MEFKPLSKFAPTKGVVGAFNPLSGDGKPRLTDTEVEALWSDGEEKEAVEEDVVDNPKDDFCFEGEKEERGNHLRHLPSDDPKSERNRFTMLDHLLHFPRPPRTWAPKTGTGACTGEGTTMTTTESTDEKTEMENLIELENDTPWLEDLERQIDEEGMAPEEERENVDRSKKRVLNAQEATEFFESSHLDDFFGEAFAALFKESPKPPNPIRYVLEFGGYKIPTDEDNQKLREEIKILKTQLAAKEREVERKQQYIHDIELIHGELDEDYSQN